MKAKKTLHGWYSEEQAAHYDRISSSGGLLQFIDRGPGEDNAREYVYPSPLRYSTPDGGEVTVTCVTESPESHGTKFEDMQYVGEVVACLRPWRREGCP